MDNDCYPTLMDSELALVGPGTFALAFPGSYRSAETLTEIWLRSFKSEHTRVSYRRDLTGWLGWCAQCQVLPADARMPHMDMWIEKQRTEGAAEASIARRVSAISSWYRYLIESTADDAVPLATKNPGKTRAKPKLDADYSPTVGLSGAEADRLIGAADADGPATSALVRLLLINGLRVGSALGASVEGLGYDRGHRTLTIVRKGGHPDRFPIPPSVGHAIDAMLAARGNPDSGPLFLTPRGDPAYELWTWRLIRRLARRAKIPQAAQLSPHSLRATAITEYMNAGGSLRDAQDFARHKDPRTTRRYDKNRDDLDRHASYVLATRYGVRRDG